MKIKFCGAVNSVTGSCHLLTTEHHKILMDCGQYQGGKTLEAKNSEPFPFRPEEIDCMILSHAHVDHCGRIPLLVKQGFHGQIYCTKPTADLVKIMLKDSGYIHEKEAMWASKKAARQGKPPVEPLYTVRDAEAVFPYLVPVLYDQLIEVNDEVKIVFNDAGHILGSAITEFWIQEPSDPERITKLVFTGDIGMCDRPILNDPVKIKKADYIIMEATYGNRLHEPGEESIAKLIHIIEETYKRGGNIIIPAFAVGRTQDLIYELNKYYDSHNDYQDLLNNIDVYVDSPMATNVTQVFKNNASVFDEETKRYILGGDNPLDFDKLKFTKTTEESMMLNNDDGKTKIILSASGMCDAGRIKHHLKHGLWNPKNSVVFVGYQAPGTLGRQIVDGEEDVSIMGERIHVGAHIYNLQGFSGHADQNGLLDWLGGLQMKPENIFLVHGEADSKTDFAAKAKKELGLNCTIISDVCEYTLSNHAAMTYEEAIEDVIDDESLDNIRTKLTKIHDALENILYNTNLMINKELPPDKLVAIGNKVTQLESDTMNLGSLISK